MISLFIDTSLSDVSIALVKEGKLLSWYFTWAFGV